MGISFRLFGFQLTSKSHMHYRHPTEKIEFDIPDSWLVAAGVWRFAPTGQAFVATSNPKWPTVLVPINGIEVPKRDAGVVGLHEDRAISLMRAFSEGNPVPPIEAHRSPALSCARLSVRDGYHRYFTSIALGFAMIPVSIRPYFDMSS